MEVKLFPRPEWARKPNGNAVGIDVRVLLQDKRLLIAQLRFAEHASFDAHAAPWDCHVLCLEGAGHVLVGSETARISAGESVLWPKGIVHQLWTDGSRMVTEMIEHVHQAEDPSALMREHQRQPQTPTSSG